MEYHNRVYFGCLSKGDKFAFNFPREAGGRIVFEKIDVEREKCGTLTNAREVNNGGGCFYFVWDDHVEKL